MPQEEKRSDAELRERLSPLAYHVTQESGTEYAGSGRFYRHKDDGTYACIVCDAPLFRSHDKYDSGSGWPSYTRPIEGAVTEHQDRSHGMMRTEVRCAQCGAHLGHAFDDGPREETGMRYCINSCALDFAGSQESKRSA